MRGYATAALQSYIRTAGLREGDRLPPERELGPLLGVSRRALRDALSSMELEGAIWRGVGRGTFLGPRPGGVFAGLSDALEDVSPQSLLEARLAFEPTIAAWAALRATRQDLDLLENCARKNAEAADDTIWSRWDGAFHRAIAAATHNDIFIVLAETLIVKRQDPAWGALRIARVGIDHRRRAADDHWEIVRALKARDRRASAQAMQRHLRGVAKMLVLAPGSEEHGSS